MKTKQQLPNRRILGLVLVAVFAIVLSGHFQSVKAQWTTTGNNIANSNTGNVGVGTGATAPSSKLVVKGSDTTSANSALNVTDSANNPILYVRNDGRIGIGTTSPGYALHLKPVAGVSFFMEGAATTDVFQSMGTDPINGPAFNFGYAGSTFGRGAGFFNVRPDASATGINPALYFMTQNVTRMVIDKNGSVGMGTTNPTQLLQVEKNQNTNTMVLVRNTTAGTAAQANVRVVNDAGALGQLGVYSSLTTPYGAAVASDVHLYSTTNLSLMADTATGVMKFATGGNSEKMRIDSSGNLGLGTATPGYKLDVAGVIRSSTGGFRFPDGTVQLTASPGGTITGVTAGAGLTGGGTSGSTTVDIGAGTGVTVAADSISVNYGSTAGTAVQGNTSVTVSAGDGMSGGGPLTLGAGGTLTLTNNDKGSSQNIFKNVANSAGTTQFSAGSNSDAVRFEGTGGASISFDALNKKVTIDASAVTSSQWTTSGSNINYATAGNVGIGTGTPTYKLHVTGDGRFTGNLTVDGNLAAKYQDLAEWVPSSEQLPAGTVVVLDSTKSNHVTLSTVSYDTRVAGVISAQPGIALGEGGANKVLVATTGRVRVKVDATRAPIQVGDLLVTSDIPGLAMKSEPVNLGGVQLHRPGTLIGKALEPLSKGSGEILVLLSLQ